MHGGHFFFFFFFFFIIHLFCIVWREGQGRYELLTMVGAGGPRTCVHPHVSRPLYHSATDAGHLRLVWIIHKYILEMHAAKSAGTKAI